MTGLRARSPVEGMREAIDWCISSTLMFLSLSFFLLFLLSKNNYIIFFKKGQFYYAARVEACWWISDRGGRGLTGLLTEQVCRGTSIWKVLKIFGSDLARMWYIVRTADRAGICLTWSSICRKQGQCAHLFQLEMGVTHFNDSVGQAWGCRAFCYETCRVRREGDLAL